MVEERESGMMAVGSLALVATPIGNLEDMTFRAVRVLSEADLIAAEDTRRARVLCDHYGVHTALTSYHAHNEHGKTSWLLDQVEAGKRVAVLSDAGTPVISDPGYLLVREALARDIEPLVIPGVSALTFAVVAAGLPAHEFHFVGFLPVKSGRRRSALESFRDRPATYFVYEGPHRVGRLLDEIGEVLGAETRVAVIREATKVYEECLRGPVADIIRTQGEKRWRGEFVIGIDSRPVGDTSARG
jgi:16S rRNA (cytidine1402-2'-O)-methyltransferase